MSAYIVEQHSKRYGPFDSPHEANSWADRTLARATYSVVYLHDKSEAEPPRLEVGNVVRAKDRRDRVGMPFYVPGGSEGVVTAKRDSHVTVVFHAVHDHEPKHDWTSQQVDRRDLLKADRGC